MQCITIEFPFSQGALGEAFGDLANRSPELAEEFNYNSETQRTLVKNGEILIGEEDLKE